ncbi:beta-galactosidase 7-like [Malania oleifera]|uniref:beta-galactosidase 7-like n=1 Tax=Malania oleifera TaxID=397392 RepID=UPI0025ADAB42|nr:beta-galactosidase 7-like [Malania oleifera]
MWPSLIRKSKEGGLNAIETYVFWNAHEPHRRQYDFSGNLDFVRFLKTVQDEGLYAVLRIGPYVCAEWNYGGFPMWLHNMPNIKLRTNNPVYMNEMQNFTTLIVDMARRANLFASQGGPIIIAQIENEYGNVMSSYGESGKEYIKWCANMAESQKISEPWIMCQQDDAPQPMINTCNGWYCDQFQPNNPNSPKMWTENWTGWYKNWGMKDPHRTAEDVAFSVALFFQNGGTFHNYYMYHGGTNFGRTSGGPYITTSYDYDAPLDEYGNLNQPKWGHLKQLHLILRSLEKVLTSGEVKNIDYGNMTSVTIYTLDGKSSCFFGNANESNDSTITFQGNNYTIPAWSVSILPECRTEVYNTAKVNTQHSLMVKREDEAEDEPDNLKWSWKPEPFERISRKNLKGAMIASQLLDQKVAANDASDYLWYMTSVKIDKNNPDWGNEITLRVNTSGHVLHAFVNGKHIGSQWSKNGTYKFVFEKQVQMRHGSNQISLLSVTVGFAHYGANFDLEEAGIHGPVELIAAGNVTKDLSSYKWVYKVGLLGEHQGLYKAEAGRLQKWHTDDLLVNKMFVWYKTTFKAPLGDDPVVVDLLGLGKGHAWVNGHSIGRYWPSFLADEDGCTSTCDYRGAYSDNKCLTNCGKPSQRWYHVPRSFLQDDENTLVLFEEFGGNPSSVNFRTVTVGTACANAYEGNTVELSCQGGKTISEIKFASFGDPQGACGSFKKGSCEAANATAIIQEACIGQKSCSVYVSEATFGSTGCNVPAKSLAVEALC